MQLAGDQHDEAHTLGLLTKRSHVSEITGRVEPPPLGGNVLCRDIGGHKSTEIADYFGLKKIGSISNTIGKLDAQLKEDEKLARTVAKIKQWI